MAAIFWNNVVVTLQSALAATKTITALTNANPGVATSTSHGYTNGQFVVLNIVGMPQLEGRVVRVANVAINTFELEGVDTTSLGTFSSGTAQLITFGKTMATMSGVSVSGGDPEFADISTIHENVRREVPTIFSTMKLEFDSLFDPADAALVELKLATDTATKRAVKITFASGSIVALNSYVAASLIPTGSFPDVVKTAVALTAYGRPTVYSS